MTCIILFYRFVQESYKTVKSKVMKNKEFYFLAIRNQSEWSKNDQYMICAQNWQDAVNTANTISLIHNKETRLSESNGYNNQGHYFNNF